MSLMKDQQETLGVLQNTSTSSPPFSEAAYCRKLCLAGQKHRVAVVVFSPEWMNSRTNTVKGYTLDSGRWVCGEHKLPRLVYDRMTYTNETQFGKCRNAITHMKRQGVTWLGIGLRGKWDLYRSLSQAEALKPILPPTSLYEGPRQLADFINQHHGGVFLKPHGGSQGRSVIYIQRVSSSAHSSSSSEGGICIKINGRNANNEPFIRDFTHPGEALKWIHQFIHQRKYVMQPYLTLYSLKNEPFDIRVLMQKNEHGRWSQTGMAARVGSTTSVTSNLHGGGHAFRADAFLEEQYGHSEAQRLLEQIERYSEYIPTAIEERHGRLIELGLDYGIDRDRRLWLLEANSKPGRSVFTQTGDREASTLAVEMPILYARYVWVRHLRRVCP
ncbi:YheC/YheD family endospore coat-associated protein [Paenibacillus marinisediminis]